MNMMQMWADEALLGRGGGGGEGDKNFVMPCAEGTCVSHTQTVCMYSRLGQFVSKIGN